MILPTYLAALAAQAAAMEVTLPRRLAFAVNRRVLVDEATRLCERLHEIVVDGVVPELTRALASLSPSDRPLVVSTLRGEFEDNGAWSADPTTPALILATPDMLGSRLLFRGYGGLGRNRAPLQAGLLGIYTLIVHDEAHLAPAFTALLREIETRAAPQAGRLGHPALHVLEMTATLSPGGDRQRLPLECDPAADPALRLRMQAGKRLRIEPVATPAERQKCIVFAIRSRIEASQTIAVFVSSPDKAQ